MSNGKWKEEELFYLKENYQTKTYAEIAEYLGRSKSAVDLKINRLGLKKSKYIYNHGFFKKIETEQQAYWLGFIFADGCVTHNKETNSCELCIKIQAKDAGHLRKFNKSLNGNIDVRIEDRLCNLNNKMHSSAIIRLYSKELVFDLINLGVIPNKSIVKQFPNIKEELLQHFIRGYFDGNGCIAVANKKYGYLRADFTCGSIKFLEVLREKLYSVGIFSHIHQEKENTYRLCVYGQENCDNFFKYIYHNQNICLDRKLSKQIKLYKEFNCEQRLLRSSEMTG